MAPMIEERLIEDIVRVVEHNRRGSVTSLTVMENLDSSSFAGSTEEFTNLNDARVRSDSVENNTNIGSNSNGNGNSSNNHKDANNKSDANDADETQETTTEDHNASEDHNHDGSEDLLVHTTKSLQSLDLTSQDETHKDEAILTCKSLPIPESHQDSTQKLSDDSPTACADSSSHEKPPEARRGSRRRRRSLKDSLQALFSATSSSSNSNSNHSSKRSSSPKARQRSSSPRSIHSGSSSSRGFTLSSLVQKTKRRSLHRKKNRRSRHHGGRRRSSFASMDLQLDLGGGDGRSGPLRQSSSTVVTMRQSTSTAFTMAAREASEHFQLNEVMSDIEDDSCEALTPSSFQLDQTAATIH